MPDAERQFDPTLARVEAMAKHFANPTEAVRRRKAKARAHDQAGEPLEDALTLDEFDQEFPHA